MATIAPQQETRASSEPPSEVTSFETLPPSIDPLCALLSDAPMRPSDHTTLDYASAAGLVFLTRRIVPETAGYNAPTFTFCFYLQAGPEAQPRAVYSERTTRAPGVVGIIGGDTVVFLKTGSEFYGLLARSERPLRRFASVLDGELAVPIAAYDDGVVLQGYRVGQESPIVFIPWNERGLALDRRIEIDDAAPAQEHVCRSGDLFVWASSHMHVFDLRNRQRRDHDIGASGSSVPRLSLCDDEVAVFTPGSSAPAQHAFVIATGAPLPARFADDSIAVRNRYAYSITPAPTSRVTYVLLRRDLEAENAVVRVAAGLDDSRPVLALQAGLYIWNGSDWRRFDWATR